jgi:hypothetical protein
MSNQSAKSKAFPFPLALVALAVTAQPCRWQSLAAQEEKKPLLEKTTKAFPFPLAPPL